MLQNPVLAHRLYQNRWWILVSGCMLGERVPASLLTATGMEKAEIDTLS